MSRRPDLAERLAALQEAVRLGDGVLPEPELQSTRDLLAKAGERRALGDATVVALAGATGSGKSSLFNVLAGAELSASGVRRPTTGTAHAATWGGTPGPLLDWLEVPRRSAVAPDPALEGLVLLDLPDHDSTRVQHRLEVDRLVELVDVLVWVLDPQKYADAAVHEAYLRPYSRHAGSLLVVLNQVDRLPDPGPVLADLRRLLDDEGLAATPLLAVSARSGQGVQELRGLLRERVQRRRAATDRLAADAARAAGALARHCGPPAGAVDGRTRARLVDALAGSAGVPVVTSAVRRSAVQQVRGSTAWPALRWTRRLRPDPLARLHLSGPGAGPASGRDGGPGSADPPARTSLAPAGEVEQARLTRALREVQEAVVGPLPQAWRDAARTVPPGLPAALDRAVAGADLRSRPPLWARGVGLLQWLLLAAALTGAVWLLALLGLGYLLLEPPVPEVEGLPVPTVLLVLGLLAGLLLGTLTRPLAALTGRRRAARAERTLRQAVQEVATTRVLAPLEAERVRYDDYCAAVRRAA